MELGINVTGIKCIVKSDCYNIEQHKEQVVTRTLYKGNELFKTVCRAVQKVFPDLLIVTVGENIQGDKSFPVHDWFITQQVVLQYVFEKKKKLTELDKLRGLSMIVNRVA